MRIVAAAALLLHAPMLVYLHTKPADWLNAAWGVSAVLVGLVITLIIFLLQAAGAQSLRSEATFTAVLRRTYVLWPVFFAITFIAITAPVERFAATTPSAPSEIETYVVSVFVLQVALFGWAILQAIRVVSPEGVSKTISAQFRDGVFIAVERDLHQRIASQLILDSCRDHNVSYGSFLAKGWAVAPTRSGWVKDIDLLLPRRLEEYLVAGDVTLTAQPGEATGTHNPVARSTIPVKPWLIREIRKGIRVTSKRPFEAPLGVFNDAVDLSRRAFLDGSRMSHEMAVHLIVDCVTVYHEAYGLYGIEY